jgi:hypothetical protein
MSQVAICSTSNEAAVTTIARTLLGPDRLAKIKIFAGLTLFRCFDVSFRYFAMHSCCFALPRAALHCFASLCAALLCFGIAIRLAKLKIFAGLDLLLCFDATVRYFAMYF